MQDKGRDLDTIHVKIIIAPFRVAHFLTLTTTLHNETLTVDHSFNDERGSGMPGTRHLKIS